MAIKVLSIEQGVDIPLVKSGGGIAKAVIWPGMGAKYGSMHYFMMKPGGENVLHAHDEQEDMFYVVQGKGYVLDGVSGEKHAFRQGDFIYVEPGTLHAVVVTGTKNYISVGGPTPPDHKIYLKMLEKNDGATK